MRSTTEQKLEPGRGLEFLPTAELPEDLTWAAANERVAQALARWSAVIENKASETMGDHTRFLISQRIDKWCGEPAPLSRSWTDDLVENCAAQDRDTARLALLAAMASYQISDDLVNPLVSRLGERGLVTTLAWGAFAGARRVARWVSTTAYDNMKTNIKKKRILSKQIRSDTVSAK